MDSNVPMYLVGRDQRLKSITQLLVKQLIEAGQRLVTDAEVLQELLHRYNAINRAEAAFPAMLALLDIVDVVFPIDEVDILRAAAITQGTEQWSARDAVHLAIMERHDVREILSFDSDFDRWPGLTRIYTPLNA